MGKVIAKTKKEEKKETTKQEELVELLIRELPNLFDSFPHASISRTAVEKFVRENL